MSLEYVRIPTEFDFTSYTNLVQLKLTWNNQTIKLSHHPKLEYISLIGDLLETQSNEFRVVCEDLIFEEVIEINKIRNYFLFIKTQKNELFSFTEISAHRK